MTAVDEKVVRMTFDNAKFESAVQTTLNTLGNLKNALKFDKVSSDFEKLQQASNKVNFNHMSDSLDQISNRFSTFGIIGVTALQNITTYAMKSAKSLLNSITSPLIEGGKRRALNIEQAKFQIQGLGYAWEQVSEDINYGVKNTAYGLDSAAKAASQLLASNVQIGDSMKAALRGISGVAAMTSSSYDDIARVFTTVAGNGRLMGDQLNQLSARGLNVAATLGKALGKTEGEIREMVSAGEIDFATFSKAMDDAFGEHAKKANDTFTGSLSNMKAALSRIGANFATPAYTNLRYAMNAITPAIDGVNKALSPLVATATEAMEIAAKLAQDILGNLDLEASLAEPMKAVDRVARAMGKTLTNIAQAILKIVSPIVNAFRTAFGMSIVDLIVQFSEAVADLTSQFIISDEMATTLGSTFGDIFSALRAVMDILAKVGSFIANDIFNYSMNTFGFIAEITLMVVNHIIDLGKILQDLIGDFMGLETVKDIFSLLSDILGNIRSETIKADKAFKGLVKDLLSKTFETSVLVFTKIADVIKKIVHFVNDVIVKIKEFIILVRDLPVVQEVIERMTSSFDTLRTKISDVSSTLQSKFWRAFDKSSDILGKVTNKVKNLIDKYIELPTKQEAIEKLQTFLNNVLDGSVDVFEKVQEVMGKVISRIKELGEVSFWKVVDNLGALRDKMVELIDIGGKFEFVKNVFLSVRDGLIDVSNQTGGLLGKIKEKLSQFVDWLGTKFSNISMGDLIAAGAGGSLIAFMLSFSKFLNSASVLADSATKAIGAITALPGAVAKVLGEFANLEKAKAQAIKMEAITGIIKAVALLAGAVALLATMDQNKVERSAAVLGILGGALILLTGVMTSLSSAVNPEQVVKASALMMSFAGAMIVLVGALKLLSLVDMSDITTRLTVMGILMAELAAFTIVVSKFAPTMSQGSIAIVGISISILALVKAFSNLSEIKTESIIAGTILMGSLVLMLGLMNKVAGKSKNSAVSAMAIVAVAVSLGLVINALKKMGEMDSGVVERGINGMIAVLFSVEALLLGTSLAGKYAIQAGASMILMGAALHVIVEAIEKLGSLDEGTVSRAESVVGKILILFGALTATTKLAGEHAARAGAAIIMMSGALVLIAGAMAIMSKIDEKGLEQATTAITQVMVMFSLIIASTSVVKKAEKTITTMTICIAALGGVLAVLSLLEPRNLEAASAAINSLMGMFAILLIASEHAGKVEPSMFVMVGVTLALGIILKSVAELPVENALAAGASLSLFLLSFAATLKIVEDLPPTALAGFTVLLGAVTEFGIFLGLIGGLTKLIPEVQEFVESGIPLLSAIGEGLGSFVGSIVGGFIGTSSEGFVSIADNLSAFMDRLSGFIDGAKSIDSSAQTGIDTLVGMVLALSAANFLDSIAIFSDVGDSLSKLAENLPKVGEAINSFGDSISADKIESVSMSMNALSQLMISLPREVRVGLGGLFASGIDWEGLSYGLPKLGSAIKGYAENIAGMDTQSVYNTQQASQIIVELANSIPQTYGGLASLVTGGTFLDDFADRLPKFGHGLFMYAENIAGMDTQSVYNTQQAAQIIIELSNSIPNTFGGLAAMFAGGTFIDDFANQLPMLGHAFFMYAENIAGMDTQSVYNTQQASQIILSLADSLPKTFGGLAGMFTGGTFIDDLSNQLPMLGHAFFMYAENIAGMDTQSVYNTTAAAEVIVGLCEYISASSGFLDISRAISMVDISANLPPLAHAFFMYAENIAGMDTQSVYNTTAAAKMIVDLCNYISDSAGFLSISRDIAVVDMAANVPLIAQAFHDYGSIVSDLNSEAITSTIEPIKNVVSLLDHIANSGILGSVLVTTTSFPSIIADLGRGFTDFSNNLSGFNTAAVDESIASIQKLVDFIPTLTSADISGAQNFSESLRIFAMTIKTDFIDSLKGSAEEASSAGSKLGSSVGNGFIIGLNISISKIKGSGARIVSAISSGIKSGQVAVNSAVDVLINGIVSRFDWSAAKMTTAGKNVSSYIANGVSNGNGLVIDAVENVLSNALTTISGQYGRFKDSGKQIMTSIAAGVRANSSTLQISLNSAISSAARGFSTSNFYSVGKNICLGIANGIRDNQWRVQAKASAAATAALEAANATLKINSPSKEFWKTGSGCMEGMAKGIKETTHFATNESKYAATKVLDVANDAISKIDASGLDFNPTITPIVDMSKVDYGLQVIGSEFDKMNPAIGMNGNISGFIGAMSSFDSNQNSLALMSKLDELIRSNQNGSSTNIYIDGAVINDDAQMENVTRDFLMELARKGAM